MVVLARPELEERILDAAEARLFQGGYRALNLDELAAELGMSKKTLYQVFERKEAIAKAVIARLHTRMTRGADEILEQDADPVDRLREMVAFVTRALAPLNAPLLADLKRHVPELWCDCEEMRDEQLTRMRGVIAEGVAEGLFRPEIDPYVATEMFVGGLERMLESERVASGQLSVAQVLESTLAILLEGVRVPVG